MRVLPCGREAVLLEFADGAEAGRYAAGLHAAGATAAGAVRAGNAARGAGAPGVVEAGVVEVVPAARTLLVRAVSEAAWGFLLPWLRGVTPGEPGERAAREVLVEVVYDGPDLDDVAALRGTSPEAVAAAHAEATWTAAFCGFSPGFAYLTSADGAWDTPRLASPRPRVPAGSVALAGPYSGCYPADSPGGWRLIGRTQAPLWDPRSDPPALLVPGTRVRFLDVTGRARRPDAGGAGPEGTTGPGMTPDRGGDLAGSADDRSLAREATLEVLGAGVRTLVEDLGRAGHAGWGVGRSGAADRGAHRLANRLLGNDEADATLEILAGGLELRALRPTIVAIAGAPVACAVDGRPAPFAEPVYLRGGARLRLGTPSAGLRTYLAVLGGIAAPATLGSRSRDTIARLGPEPLKVGDRIAASTHAVRTDETGLVGLAVGPAGRGRAAFRETTGAGSEAAAAMAFRGPDRAGAVLGGTWGPRADWFTKAARDLLARASWRVRPDSDRVGVRCEGPALIRSVRSELPSEPVVRGSIQVPPSGRPIIFLADHPTTGGYPVIGVLDPAAVDMLAQARPGDSVRIGLTAPPYPTDLGG